MRTIVDKKWVNRGFLFGPIIPIYGVGALLAVIITDIFVIKWWQMFIIGFFASAVLEYATSYILEKLFHAYWWDYRDDPLNINGRTDIIYDVLFALAGLLIVYILNPKIGYCISLLNSNLLEINSLILMGLLAMDLTITVSGLSEFTGKFIMINQKANQKLQEGYDEAEALITEYKEMVSKLSKPALIALNKIKGLKSRKFDNLKLKESVVHLKSFIKEKLKKIAKNS